MFCKTKLLLIADGERHDLQVASKTPGHWAQNVAQGHATSLSAVTVKPIGASKSLGERSCLGTFRSFSFAPSNGQSPHPEVLPRSQAQFLHHTAAQHAPTTPFNLESLRGSSGPVPALQSQITTRHEPEPSTLRKPLGRGHDDVSLLDDVHAGPHTGLEVGNLQSLRKDPEPSVDDVM